MKKIYYTTSLELKTVLQEFEELHKEILFKKISPKMEIKLQSETTINRMYHTLRLSDIDCRRSRMVDLLMHHKSLNKNERMILDMKSLLDSFYYEWKFNNSVINVDFISKIIYSIEKRKVTLNTALIENDLFYIQLEKSPLIQAALVYLMFIAELNNPTATIMSTLMAWFFLFKKGYDFRRIISFQRSFMNDRDNYRYQLEQGIKQQNVTPWIIYFGNSLNQTAKEELLFIDDVSENSPLQTNILSDRHVRILSLISDPQEVITNKKIQKLFNVSQITASRDLTYLTSLGLLLVQGKGRSVKYIKI